MFVLSIKDFAINTEHVFSRPVPFEQTELRSFSEAMLKAFGMSLVPKDIILNQGDGLYNYSLSVKMFNGSVDVSVASAGLTTAFRNGRNKKALQLIGNSLVAIDAMVQKYPLQFRRLTFGAHAEFEKPEEFDLHMGKLADKKRGYTAGGLTLYRSIDDLKGEIRFSTDKSLVHEKALFLSCEILTSELFSPDVLNRMSTRFGEVAKDIELELKMAE